MPIIGKGQILQLSKVAHWEILRGILSSMTPPKISQKQLDNLLPHELLDTLALNGKVDARNQVRLPGKLVFLCLLHNLLHHKDLTLRLLEETYFQKVGKHADHSTFAARLTRIKPAYFEAIFHALYQKLAPTATKGEKQSLKLHFVDATTVTLSAKLLTFGLRGGTNSPHKARRNLKSVLELSEELPQLLHLCTDKAENSDSVALGETMVRHTKPGDLWVFDKGCNSRDRLLALHQRHAFFLTPHHQQGIQATRVVFCLATAEHPTQVPQNQEASFVVTKVWTGVFHNSQLSHHKRFSGLPLVLVEGLRFDRRSQTWKELTLLSNLAIEGEERVGPYTFLELAAVYSRRWDIEVFFKFIKQHLNWSHLTSRCENGIRVMMYMSLIVSLLLLWYKQESKIDRGWRSVKSWFAFDLEQWLRDAFDETFAALVDRHPCAAPIYFSEL
jgi:hypothetical protein